MTQEPDYAALAQLTAPPDYEALAKLTAPAGESASRARFTGRIRTQERAAGTIYADEGGAKYGDSPLDFQKPPPARDIISGALEVPVAAANAIPDTVQGLIETARVPFPGIPDVQVPHIPDVAGTEGGIAQGIGSGIGHLGVLAGTGALAGTTAAGSLAALEGFGAHYHTLKAEGASESGALLGALAQSGVDFAAIKAPLDRLAASTQGGLGKAITTGYVFGGVSGAQQVVTDAITAAATPKDMGSWLDWADRVGEATVKGGLAGLFVGAVHTAFKAMAPKEQAKVLKLREEGTPAPGTEPTPGIAEPVKAAESAPVEPSGVAGELPAEVSGKAGELAKPDTIEDIRHDVNLLREEKAWRDTMATEGATVRHDKEGWTGTVERPARSYGKEMFLGKPIDKPPLVGIRSTFGGKFAEPVVRFIDPIELSPAFKKAPIEPMPESPLAPPPAEAQPQKAEPVLGGTTGSDVSPRPGAAPSDAEGAAPINTGVKHRIVEAERAAQGMEPLDSGPVRAHEKLNQEAIQTLKDKPDAARDLVESLNEKPRPVTDAEQFLLMHERLRLSKERDALRAEGEQPGADREAIYGKIQKLRDRIDATDRAARSAGSEPARSLGARAREIAPDHSLAAIEQMYRDENKGKPLTKRQEEEAARLDERMRKAEADIEEIRRQIEIDHLKKEVRARKSKGARAVADYLKPKAEQALKELAESFKVARSGPVPLTARDLKNASIVGAHFIAEGAATAQEFGARMVEAIGEKIKPHLSEVYAAAQDLHSGQAARERKKAGVRLSIERGKEKLATGDIQPKRRPRVEPDEELLRLEAEKARVVADIERARRRAARENMSRARRASEAVLRWNRAFILSSPVVLKKLGAAGAARLAFTPVEEAIGAAYSQVFPRLAARAPREGGISAKAEAMALRDAFTKGLRDSYKTLTTGQSDIEAVHGKHEIYDRTVADFFGSLHQAIKAPVKRAEFARSFEKRAEVAIKLGMDVADPVVQARIATDAYKDANRAIFSQDNVVADAWKRAIGALEGNRKDTGKPSSGGLVLGGVGRFLQPVVKIPTNIVAEVLAHTPGGLAVGGTRLVKAYRNGIENLGPHEADTIMRLLKKGSLGSAILLLGYFNHKNIGGYYTGKRDHNEPEPKSVRVMGVDIDKDFLHNPALEVLQYGATLGRVGEKKGLGSGAFAASTGLLEEVPVAGAAEDVAKVLDPREGEGALNRIIGQRVPQVIRWLARKLDGDRKRKAKTLLENIQEGIPVWRQQLPLK